ncbi:MAG: hypothetical protein JWL72_4690 [Ilumatobacteraceae bacterium]|nr:hypothetical protein [Ilumatobacteraceae bacterium]
MCHLGDHARADEADGCGDVGGDTADVDDDVAGLAVDEVPREALNRDDAKESRTEGQQCVSACARWMAADLALEADHGTERHRQTSARGVVAERDLMCGDARIDPTHQRFQADDTLHRRLIPIAGLLATPTGTVLGPPVRDWPPSSPGSCRPAHLASSNQTHLPRRVPGPPRRPLRQGSSQMGPQRSVRCSGDRGPGSLVSDPTCPVWL